MTPKLPAALSPLVAELALLAAKNPELAEMVAKVTTSAVRRGMRKPTDINQWARAFEAAAGQFANRELGKRWSRAAATRLPVNKRSFTPKQAKAARERAR